MANPMDRWKLRTKRSEYVPERTISPLICKPVYDEDRQCWKSIFSKTLKERREKIPDVRGLFFYWENSTYTATGQSVITDTEMIRELNYPHRDDPGIRAFMWVYLEEEDDDYFFLVKGST